jgi:spore germination cell wall hydrolase CwlJ-like protein
MSDSFSAFYETLPLWGRLGMLALVVWREVRNESEECKLAVAYVVKTRAERKHFWWGSDILGVIFAPYQFTSMTHPKDPQLTRWPRENAAWKSCLTAAADALFGLKPNPVPSAEYYHDSTLPAAPKGWGAVRYLKRIDRIAFYSDGQ